MPPTHKDEGLLAARRIRELYPQTAVVLLSQYLEPRYAARLLADQPSGLGYLLKERVSDIAVLVDALRRVREGECVIDPTIVARLMRRRRPNSPLANLTERETQILRLMARGPVKRRDRQRARDQREGRGGGVGADVPQTRARALTLR